MIKNTDLRIGNWVQHSDYGNIFGKVEAIAEGIETQYSDFGREENLNPIPITPELLEKCGFVKGERGKESDFDGIEIVYHLNGVDIYDNTENGGGFDYATYTRYPGKGFKAGISISHLHQLQNLYYCLTGSELEINL